MYSEYRDLLLDPVAADRARAHLDACPACRRYDRVIRTGVSVLRDGEVETRDPDIGLTASRDRSDPGRRAGTWVRAAPAPLRGA